MEDPRSSGDQISFIKPHEAPAGPTDTKQEHALLEEASFACKDALRMPIHKKCDETY